MPQEREPAAVEFESFLWKDINDRPSFADVGALLAHYTSIDTLEKILMYGEIWLSHPFFMNDVQELRVGMEVGAEIFRSSVLLADSCGDGARHADLLHRFDTLLAEFDEEHVLDTYVLCLSEHKPEDNDGLLSMWRAYGANGGGVAIVFDSSKIPLVNDSAFVVGKVDYVTDKERIEWVNSAVNGLARILSEVGSSAGNRYLAARYYIERLKLFALFSKHRGFNEEKEWRVVYFRQNDTESKFIRDLGYIVTPHGVEPKLKLNIPNLPGAMNASFTLESLIDRVILGPTVSSTLAYRSMVRMLELLNMKDLADRVSTSTIPFRTNI